MKKLKEKEKKSKLPIGIVKANITKEGGVMVPSPNSRNGLFFWD